MDVINRTVKDAVNSGDPAQFNAAEEAAEILSRYGKDDKAGKPYDDANTFNPLADFNGDMLGMLNALRSLIDRIDAVEATVNIP
jgi:hypothetical protein